MSYVALARKYRPKNFSELVGQSVLTTTLTNAIFENRIHHAFLLTGIRGVGKTTTARIIAKNLNCIGEDGTGNATANPCEVCSNCTAIKAGSHPDVIEFDAASNTGIEDVKIIISNTHYAPILGRKKVFIIDEIHMLSTKAFNALLKTLEEPPENIVFVFATTEVKKVPITILSRCQKFFLKAIKPEEIANKLKEISKKEGFEVEKEALEIMSIKANGSMRDGISLLDQALLNSSSAILTFQAVKEMMKIPSMEEAKRLFEEISSGKIPETLELIQELTDAGLEESEIISELCEIISAEIKREALGEKKYGMPFLLRFYQILIKGIEDIKFCENKKIGLEILIIKLCYSASLPTPSEVIERLQNKELNFVLNAFSEAKIIE
jgi:DNA polymerase-3 subunit gamma/tau